MASSTAPVLPLANAVLEVKDAQPLAQPSNTSSGDADSTLEKGASELATSSVNEAIDPVAEDKLVRKQVSSSP